MMDCSQSSRRLARFRTVCFLHYNKCVFIREVNFDNELFLEIFSKIEFGTVCFRVGDVSLNMKKREQLNESCRWLVIRDVEELDFAPAGDGEWVALFTHFQRPFLHFLAPYH